MTVMPNFMCISTTPAFIASDINECEENTDGCAQTCTDTESGYICSCRSGYRLASDRHGCDGMYNHRCRKILKVGGLNIQLRPPPLPSSYAYVYN